jgi:hypothetical protein
MINTYTRKSECSSTDQGVSYLIFLNYCKVMKPLTVKSVSTIDFSPLSYAWIVRVEYKQCKTIMRNESCALFGGENQGI